MQIQNTAANTIDKKMLKSFTLQKSMEQQQKNIY